jgi:MFS family permease
MSAKKWLNRNVAAMGFTSLFSDTSHEMATATLPAFLTELVGASAPQLLGLITGLSDALSSFVKIFSGWLSDRLKKRKSLMVLGYLLTGFFVGMIGFAKSWFEILFYRVLGWIGRGTREPPRDALLAESVDRKFYGHAFGFHRAMDTLGAIIGPLLALFFIPLLGFRNIFFMSFIPGALAVLTVAIFIKEKPRILEGKVRSFFAHIKSLPKEFQFFILIMFIFGIGNFNRTLLLLRVQEVLSPTAGIILAGTLSVLFYVIRNIAQALADYGVGSLSDKFGKRTLLAIFGFFLFGIMSLGFMITSTNIFYFVFLFVLSGISAAAYTALEKAYAADLLPSNIRGTGYGALQTVDGIGDFVSSFIVGTLWVAISSSVAFLYGAILSFLAAFLLLVWMRRR